jgi:hypothetical protein
MRFLRMAVTLGCPLLKMKPRLVFGWRPLDHLQRQSSLDVAMHLYLSERMSPKIAILVVWTKKEKQAKVNSILSLMMFNQWRIRSPEYKLFMFQIMFLAWCRFTEFINGSTVDEKAARTLAKKKCCKKEATWVNEPGLNCHLQHRWHPSISSSLWTRWRAGKQLRNTNLQRYFHFFFLCICYWNWQCYNTTGLVGKTSSHKHIYCWFKRFAIIICLGSSGTGCRYLIWGK